MRERLYRYSEMFGETFQGEGNHTGKNTVWVRWYGCNKKCAGFNNMENGELKVPEKELYYNTIDISNVTDINDLPTLDVGCDTYYSWHPRFRHLAKRETAETIANKLIELNKNEFNPEGLFIHPRTGQDIHLCFTGGESMMSQDGIIETVRYLHSVGNMPINITVESNGSVKVTDEFREFVTWFLENGGNEFFWSLSPKIESVSGEKWDKSICPDVVSEYVSITPTGQLKFVCDNTANGWEQIDKAVTEFTDAGIQLPVWIMPEGASAEAQSRHHADIAEEAVRRGYYFASRVHATVFGAVPGK